jgi:hypothetical protein
MCAVVILLSLIFASMIESKVLDHRKSKQSNSPSEESKLLTIANADLAATNRLRDHYHSELCVVSKRLAELQDKFVTMHKSVDKTSK